MRPWVSIITREGYCAAQAVANTCSTTLCTVRRSLHRCFLELQLGLEFWPACWGGGGHEGHRRDRSSSSAARSAIWRTDRSSRTARLLFWFSYTIPAGLLGRDNAQGRYGTGQSATI